MLGIIVGAVLGIEKGASEGLAEGADVHACSPHATPSQAQQLNMSHIMSLSSDTQAIHSPKPQPQVGALRQLVSDSELQVDGLEVGPVLGIMVGLLLGSVVVGAWVGDIVGVRVGDVVGVFVGDFVGLSVGAKVWMVIESTLSLLTKTVLPM